MNAIIKVCVFVAHASQLYYILLLIYIITCYGSLWNPTALKFFRQSFNFNNRHNRLLSFILEPNRRVTASYRMFYLVIVLLFYIYDNIYNLLSFILEPGHRIPAIIVCFRTPHL